MADIHTPHKKAPSDALRASHGMSLDCAQIVCNVFWIRRRSDIRAAITPLFENPPQGVTYRFLRCTNCGDRLRMPKWHAPSAHTGWKVCHLRYAVGSHRKLTLVIVVSGAGLQRSGRAASASGANRRLLPALRYSHTWGGVTTTPPHV